MHCSFVWMLNFYGFFFFCSTEIVMDMFVDGITWLDHISVLYPWDATFGGWLEIINIANTVVSTKATCV